MSKMQTLPKSPPILPRFFDSAHINRAEITTEFCYLCIMKIRIKGNSVRLRLTQSEVDRVKTEGEVSEKTEFGSGLFIYRLVLKPTEELDADFIGGRIVVTMPEETGIAWAIGDEVGIEGTTENGVSILIEKDFQCLTERAHEDESDLFPNPNESC